MCLPWNQTCESRNVIVFCALLFHSGASVSPDQVLKTVDDNTKFSD